MVRTWPNLETIRLAIESEASLSGVSLEEAAGIIAKAAKEWTHGPQNHVPADWVRRELCRINDVDRFWFEDARWRVKDAYIEFRNGLGESEIPA